MISVVVPTYERTQCLYDMLESIDGQEYEDFEVLVIDQSPDTLPVKVERILKSCRMVRYFKINVASRPVSKNFAIGEAKGDVILFCDDDIIADPKFLSEHWRVHKEFPSVGGVSCHLIEPHEKEIRSNMPLKITVFGRFINRPNALYNGFVTSINGGNMSFKKEALDRVGFFEENLVGTSMLEEPDLAYRLMKCGYKLYFSSGTKVKHFPQHNGNTSTRRGKSYIWQRDYFVNQFYFMYRNQRQIFFPLIFFYLSYRTAVESIKSRKASLKFLMLPLTSLVRATKIWKRKKAEYNMPWYTSQTVKVEKIFYGAKEHEPKEA